MGWGGDSSQSCLNSRAASPTSSPAQIDSLPCLSVARWEGRFVSTAADVVGKIRKRLTMSPTQNKTKRKKRRLHTRRSWKRRRIRGRKATANESDVNSGVCEVPVTTTDACCSASGDTNTKQAWKSYWMEDCSRKTTVERDLQPAAVAVKQHLTE